jgi:hypothetical protein
MSRSDVGQHPSSCDFQRKSALSENKFVIVGPPAMGKSTLLRLIPSVIRFATAIDLELLMKCNSGEERGSVHAHVRHISAMPWNGPLFLGNAAAYFPFISSLGFRVIALHHPDHKKYLEWMNGRDRREGQPNQGITGSGIGTNSKSFEPRIPKES